MCSSTASEVRGVTRCSSTSAGSGGGSISAAFCFFCAFGTVIVAQGRTLFPDRLAGRGVTTVNMAQCLGLTVLPALVGYIVEAFGNSDLAYRVAFAALAIGLVLGASVYVRSRDSATALPA